MTRKIRIAAAQIGAVHRTDPREATLQRMLKLLENAGSQGAELVLFPETAFTTFFPRHLINDPDELSSWFEHGDVTKSPNTAPLFAKATDLNVDIAVGFAEAADNGERFNACVYYHAKTGSVLSKYRKIHLPGDFEPFADPKATNQLEKRYFKPGDLGFEAFRVPELANGSEPIMGMMICNDRRWPEAWRCFGLQGVEVVLCGYNTAGFAPDLWGSDKNQDPQKAEESALFHHKLVMQANSYMNATFSVSAARCGMDDGKYSLIGGSCITGPEGDILAEAQTVEDEIIIADCDLDLCTQGKTRTFDFARHRRTEHYGRILEQTGVVEPPRLNQDDKATNGEPNGEHAPSNINRSATPDARRKIRILLCNPNATKSMTDNCVKMVEPTLPADVEVVGFTAPTPAPFAVEGNVDNIMSAAAACRTIIPMQQREGYDAMLVACYSDHALIRMLREEFDVPVIGIMEASLITARTLGARFGIVATSNRSKVMHGDAVRHYGMEGFCAGVESCNIGVLDLERKPRSQILGIMQDVARSLVAKGAETLTLGCAGMTDMKAAVEEAVGEDCQVVDGVVAGVHHLVGMVRMGGKTAKCGMYASSSKARKMRSQEYV
ncbi:carbon-nitrogen hydrolase [Hortaea werneckii]|nr:carbon-nitrogen hydrolase [Hortaea werneckii]